MLLLKQHLTGVNFVSLSDSDMKYLVVALVLFGAFLWDAVRAYENRTGQIYI